MQTSSNSSTNRNDQSVNLVDLFVYLASKWKWFLLSVIICGGIAWFKYATAPSNKTYSAGLDRYDNFINKINVANEILQFRSKRLMREVVQRVHADVSYQMKSGLRWNELYTQSPVKVSFVDLTPERYMAFTVTPKSKKTVMVSEFSGEQTQSSYTVQLNDTLRLREGRVIITPTNFYNDSWTDVAVKVQKNPLNAVVGYYQGSLGIRQAIIREVWAYVRKRKNRLSLPCQ